MGLHTGVASLRDGDYFGSSLNRAARLMGVAHGGQVVCSQATTDLARDVLAEGVDFVDLGEHRLRDLSRAERVFQVCAPGLVGDFAALTSVDAFPGNLPLQSSSFIGREREIDRTVAALSEARVVTLTGVGGVGKTRLALQVAAEVLPGFREGAWLIELAAVRDPDDVIDAFASVFGLSARAGQSLAESLAEFLQTKQLLLVVDNCEHVLDAVADLVEEISWYLHAGRGAGDEPGGSGPRRRADVRGAGLGGAGGGCGSGRGRRVGCGAALRGARPCGRRRFRAQCCERVGGGAGLSSSRRGALGDRVGGGAGHVDEPGRVGLGVGSPVRSAGRGAATGGETPTDAAGDDRLVLRPARRGPAAAADPARGVRRGLHPRGGGGDLCREGRSMAVQCSGC